MAIRFYLIGEKCFRAGQLQWAPTLTSHDPSPPIVLETPSGGFDLAAPLLTDGDSFPAATVSPGAVSLTSPLLTVTQSFPAATVVVAGDQSLTAPLHTNVPSFPSATISVVSDTTLTAPLYTNVPTFPSAIATGAGSVYLDAPAYELLVAAGLVKYAWGFDRLVHGYAGNTVRLKRLSDNVQQDFGFNELTGIFDLSAVDTWRSSANVDVVYFIDQMGSAAQLTSLSTVALIRSNVVGRFGTTWNSSNDMLSRSTTDGAVGANLGDGVGALEVVATGLSTTAGFESHLLVSSNERKRPSNFTDPLGLANNTSEIYFAVGHSTSVRFYHQITGGNHLSLTRLQTTASDQDQSSTSAGNYQKQYSQHVYSYKLEPDRLSIYTAGKRYLTDALIANNVTNLAAGALNSPKFVVGGNFASTANNSVSASSRANILFSGLIVTTPLTDLQRYLIQSMMSAVGQQHRIKSIGDIRAYFEELVVLKDANPATGLATGRSGLLSLQFNKTTVPEGTPNFEFGYTHPSVGIKGIYAPDDDNNANGFKATTTYFAGNIRGTVLSLHFLDPTSAGVTAAELNATFIQGTGSPYGLQNADWSLGLGFDHNAPTFTGMAAGSRDDDGIMGTRHKSDGTPFGALVYDMANQAMGKYNRNTAHVTFVYDENVAGHVWDEADWANAGDAPYTLDAPVIRPLPSNLQFPWRHDALILQLATFDAPSSYHRADSYATRRPLRLSSVNKSYAAAGCTPIGHDDGAIAINNYAGVVDSDDNAYIMSHHFQQAFQGARFLFGFSPNVFTLEQIEETQTNLYKLFGLTDSELSVSTFVDSQDFPPATVTGHIGLTSPKLTDTLTFPPATITLGIPTLALTAPKHTNTSTFFPATISRGPVSVTAPLLTNTSVFRSARIISDPIPATAMRWWVMRQLDIMAVDNDSVDGMDLSSLPSDMYMLQWRGGKGELESNGEPRIRTTISDIAPYVPLFTQFLTKMVSKGLTLKQAKKIQSDLVHLIYESKRQAPFPFSVGATTYMWDADDAAAAAMAMQMMPQILVGIGAGTTSTNSLVSQINTLVSQINARLVSIEANENSIVYYTNNYAVVPANAAIDVINANAGQSGAIVSHLNTTVLGSLGSGNTVNNALQTGTFSIEAVTYYAAMPGLSGNIAHSTASFGTAGYLSATPNVTALSPVSALSGPSAWTVNIPWIPYGSTTPVNLTVAQMTSLMGGIAARQQLLTNAKATKVLEITALTTVANVIAYNPASGWPT